MAQELPLVPHQENFSCLARFTIYGSPARKSNSRMYTGSHFVLGKAAAAYANIFAKQIRRVQARLHLPLPFDDPSLYWVFSIWYNRRTADASVELLFDLMQEHGLLTNDVTLRKYAVLAEQFDAEVPRTTIAIYKKE